MRFAIILALFTSLITSCAGEKKVKVDPDTGLTENEYQQAKLINNAMVDVASALNLAFEARVAEAPSEKATELSKLINPSDCAYTPMRTPTNKYGQSWSGERKVSGTQCPVQHTDQVEYTNTENRRTFKIVERSFAAKGKDFQNQSALVSYAIKDGKLEWTTASGNIQTIAGRFEYTNFRVNGLGLVFATISTQQKYAGNRGQGQLRIDLQTRTKLKVRLDVRWTQGRTPTYRINNTNVSELAVRELFSAFPINELMEYSNGMRY